MERTVYHRAGVQTRADFWKVLAELLKGVIPHKGLLAGIMGVEVGVQKGEFSEQLLAALPDLYLHGIDPWVHQPTGYRDIANVSTHQQELYRREALLRLERFGGRFTEHRGFSPAMAEGFSPAALDFVYFDGNHSLVAQLADLYGWWPKLRPGGIFSGHDFVEGPNLCGSEFGVVSAVNAFMADPAIGLPAETRLYVTEEQWPTWWFTKPTSVGPMRAGVRAATVATSLAANATSVGATNE